MMIIVLVTIVGLVGFLALGDKYVRLREACKMAYFAGLLALLLQYGTYFDSLLKR